MAFEQSSKGATICEVPLARSPRLRCTVSGATSRKRQSNHSNPLKQRAKRDRCEVTAVGEDNSRGWSILLLISWGVDGKLQKDRLVTTCFSGEMSWTHVDQTDEKWDVRRI
jgi:hypothetical protein